MRKILVRTFWGFFILLVVGTGLVLGLTYWYKSSAVQEVERALQQYCKGEVRYKWSSLGFFRKWGELTLSFYQVDVVPKKSTSKEVLARIGQVHFSLDWGALWEQKYKVKRVYVEELDAEPVFLQYWQMPANTTLPTKLADVWIERAQFDIPHVTKENLSILNFEKINLTFQDYSFQKCLVKVQINSYQFLHKKQVHWEVKDMQLETEIAYTPKTNTFQFYETNLKIRNSSFDVRGSYSLPTSDAPAMDIKFRGREENLQALLALLHTPYYEELAGYKSKGKVTFSGSIRGAVGKGKFPVVDIVFGGQNFEVVSPHSLQQTLTNCSLEGNINSSTWRIMEWAGKMGTQKFKSSFTLHNWQKPHIVADLEAGIDLSLLHEFYPIPRWESLKGLAGVKMHIDTDIAEVGKVSTESKKIIATGEFELINAQAKPQEGKLHDKVNAKIVFQNDLAEIRNLQTTWGVNDLTMKGKVQNWLAYLTMPEQILYSRGEVTVKYLNVEDFTTPTCALPTYLQGQVRVRIDSLTYRKWQAKNLKADFTLKDKILKSGNLTAQIAEGTVSFLGMLNAQKENFMTLDGRVMAKGLQIAQIKHAFPALKDVTGKLDLDARSGLVLDKSLTLKWNNAVFDADLTLTNGELKNIQLLEDLAQKVQISELKQINYKEIHVLLQLRNQTLFVPECELTGVYNMGLVGRATSEKGLDFRLRLQPKRNLVYHVNWTGEYQNSILSFPPETEQPHLETHWQREKDSYLKIFKRNTTHEGVKIDTMKIE
jgi:hypothetical protein